MTRAEIVFLVFVAGGYAARFLRRRLHTHDERSKGLSAGARRTLMAASTLIRRQKRSTITAADVVYVALFDPEVTRAIDLSRPALENLRNALLRHLVELPPTDLPLELDAAASTLFERAAERAKDDKRDALTPSDLVAVAAGAAGIPPGVMDGVRLEQHPNAERTDPASLDYRGTSPPDLRQVIVWDDDKTTMEHVVDVVTTCFAKSEVEATLLMLETHDEGAASLGTYTPAEAVDLVRRANESSRSQGMPLRLTLESTTFRPPERSWWSRLRSYAPR
jgi:ATP-dependent Clp protease adapter protein ClpS/histone H3/H4